MATKAAKRYRVTGLYVTAPTMTEMGPMYVSLNSGAMAPEDVPDWWVQHHLDNNLIEAVEEEPPPPEPDDEKPAGEEPKAGDEGKPAEEGKPEEEGPKATVKPDGPARSAHAPRARGG